MYYLCLCGCPAGRYAGHKMRHPVVNDNSR